MRKAGPRPSWALTNKKCLVILTILSVASATSGQGLIPQGGLFGPIRNLFSGGWRNGPDEKVSIVHEPEVDGRNNRGIFGQLYSLFSTSVDLASKIQKTRDRNGDSVTQKSDKKKLSETKIDRKSDTVSRTSLSTTTVTTTTTKSVTRVANASVTTSGNGSVIIGGNGTSFEEKGIFDDIANGITSFFDSGGPSVDSGSENLGIVPNHCW